MLISKSDFEALEALIYSDEGHTELACAKYLHHAATFLLPSTPIKIDVGTEARNFFGSTDFIVSATIRTDTNQEANYAFIWELKSPQTYLFEFDDSKNRCKPTIEYLKAENQLLHYAYQAQSDQDFRMRFNVMDYRNIRIGGVIIGRSSDRMLRGSNTAEDIRKAQTALSVRENYFYPSQKIRLLTWDRILEFVKP